MTQIKNKYLGSLRTESIHLKSANKIITDAPVDNNGKGEAFSPSDLVCAALASCMMTIMGIVAEREKIDLSGLEADVTKVMVASPRKISEIHVTLRMPSAGISDKQREVLKRAALTCPVALSIHPDIKQEVKFDF
ncbi:MAG: OsmC family protein [Cytophagaceae bacterium]